jgi:hypothetical protein
MPTASSNEPHGITETTGPKISSFAILILGATSAKIVGSWKKPFACAPDVSRLPPVRSCAPSALPIWTYSITFASCASLIDGPISIDGSRPSPTFSAFARATKRSTNSA